MAKIEAVRAIHSFHAAGSVLPNTVVKLQDTSKHVLLNIRGLVHERELHTKVQYVVMLEIMQW